MTHRIIASNRFNQLDQKYMTSCKLALEIPCRWLPECRRDLYGVSFSELRTLTLAKTA
jgi:hypothetical protein